MHSNQEGKTTINCIDCIKAPFCPLSGFKNVDNCQGFIPNKKERSVVTMKSNCLQTADTIINGGRQDSYGAPEDSFPIISGYWNIYIAEKIRQRTGESITDLLEPLDVTNLMVLFKQARKLGQSPSIDNHVDSCGYEAIGADRFLSQKQLPGGVGRCEHCGGMGIESIYDTGSINDIGVVTCPICKGSGKKVIK